MCLLNEIVDNTSLRNVNASQVISLVWCTISFVHHFYCDLGSGINMKKLKSRKYVLLILKITSICCDLFHTIDLNSYIAYNYNILLEIFT